MDGGWPGWMDGWMEASFGCQCSTDNDVAQSPTAYAPDHDVDGLLYVYVLTPIGNPSCRKNEMIKGGNNLFFL
jgi:hypothetical protein